MTEADGATTLKADCLYHIDSFGDGTGSTTKVDTGNTAKTWTRTPKKQKEAECKTIINDKLNMVAKEYAVGAALEYTTLPVQC